MDSFENNQNPVTGAGNQPVAPETGYTYQPPVKRFPWEEPQNPVVDVPRQEMPVHDTPVQQEPVKAAPPTQEPPVENWSRVSDPQPAADSKAAGFTEGYGWTYGDIPRQEPPAQRYEPVKPSTAGNCGSKSRRSAMPLLAMLFSAAVLVVCIIVAVNANTRMSALKAEQDLQQKRLDAYASRIEQLQEQLAAANKQDGTALPGTQQNPGVPQNPGDITGFMTPAQVYSQCVNSVVAIHCTGTASSFGQIMQTSSSGSGFILSDDGYVVTNYHVVEGQNRLQVVMYDGTTYEAEYIGGNESNDIALIKVDAQNLPPVTIGSSSDLIVGDQVVAIGNPLGELASTLTVGYVSAKDRIVTSDGSQINMLQTDAAINPGNSGGPLFNMYGEVIGITSAKYSGTTDSGASIEGIGFAIPTDDVMMMLEDLRNFGYITGGYLGVTVSEVSEEASELYGLPKGVLVRDVMPGSCSEKAGIRVQDIIVSLNGQQIKNLNDLSRALNKCKAGEEVEVIVYRGGGETTVSVVLDERPREETPEVTEPVSQDQYTPWPGDGFFDDWFGGFFG